MNVNENKSCQTQDCEKKKKKKSICIRPFHIHAVSFEYRK